MIRRLGAHSLPRSCPFASFSHLVTCSPTLSGKSLQSAPIPVPLTFPSAVILLPEVASRRFIIELDASALLILQSASYRRSCSQLAPKTFLLRRASLRRPFAPNQLEADHFLVSSGSLLQFERAVPFIATYIWIVYGFFFAVPVSASLHPRFPFPPSLLVFRPPLSFSQTFGFIPPFRSAPLYFHPLRESVSLSKLWHFQRSACPLTLCPLLFAGRQLSRRSEFGFFFFHSF